MERSERPSELHGPATWRETGRRMARRGTPGCATPGCNELATCHQAKHGIWVPRCEKHQEPDPDLRS